MTSLFDIKIGHRTPAASCLLPILLILLLGAGLSFGQEASERQGEKASNRQEAKTPLIERLKPSNWFRSEADSETKTTDEAPSGKNNSGENKRVSRKSTPEKTTEQTQKTEAAPSSQTTGTVSQNSGQAPLPPESNYFRRNNGREYHDYDTSDVVPLELRSSTAASPSAPSGGLASYSFDTRDWVEFFPVENTTNSVTPPPVQQPAATAQTVTTEAPVRQETLRPETTPVSTEANETAEVGHKEVFSENGREEPVKLAGIRKTDVRSDLVKSDLKEKLDSKPAKIDLTPSYSKQLTHSQICGVVVVQSNFALTSLAPILKEIEQLQTDLNLYMGVPAPMEKIELCLFRDERTYLAFLRDVFPEAPRDRRALYIKLDGKPGTLLVQRTSEFEVDIRHEMTHAIIHASIPVVPIWLDEGLAKYFEVPIADRKENNPYMGQIRRNVRFGSVPSLTRLEKLKHIGHMGPREYRDSWAWTHFLIHHSPQTHRLLAGYLQLLAKLPPPANEGDSVRFPPLEAYINDMFANPRASYREHFRSLDGDE